MIKSKAFPQFWDTLYYMKIGLRSSFLVIIAFSSEVLLDFLLCPKEATIAYDIRCKSCMINYYLLQTEGNIWPF